MHFLKPIERCLEHKPTTERVAVYELNTVWCQACVQPWMHKNDFPIGVTPPDVNFVVMSFACHCVDYLNVVSRNLFITEGT